MPHESHVAEGVQFLQGLGLSGGQKTASSSLTKNWAREDTAIQRRVADARKAGIHPLFALGASVSQTQAGSPPTGSGIGTAFKYNQRKDARERGVKSSLVDQALIEQANANARNADARTANEKWQLQNSINKRREGVANISQDGSVNMEPVTRFHPVKGKPHQLPGIMPAWNKFQIYPDLKIWAPSQELSEVFESPAMWPMIMQENHRALAKWAGRATNRMTKNHPARKFIRWIKQYSKPAKYGPMP